MKYFCALMLSLFFIVGCKSSYKNENLMRIDKNQEFKGYEVKDEKIYDKSTGQIIAEFDKKDKNFVRKINEDKKEENFAKKTGLSTLSFLSSVFYTPAKLSYAVLGSLSAGGIYALSIGYAEDTTTQIAIQAVNGDWFIAPNTIRKGRTLKFIGQEVEGGCIASQSMSIP